MLPPCTSRQLPGRYGALAGASQGAGHAGHASYRRHVGHPLPTSFDMCRSIHSDSGLPRDGPSVPAGKRQRREAKRAQAGDTPPGRHRCAAGMFRRLSFVTQPWDIGCGVPISAAAMAVRPGPALRPQPRPEPESLCRDQRHWAARVLNDARRTRARRDAKRAVRYAPRRDETYTTGDAAAGCAKATCAVAGCA